MENIQFRFNLCNVCNSAAVFADSAVSAATTAFTTQPKEVFQQTYDLAKAACELAQSFAKILQTASKDDRTDEEWATIEDVDEAAGELHGLQCLIEATIYGANGDGETEFDGEYEMELEAVRETLNPGVAGMADAYFGSYRIA